MTNISIGDPEANTPEARKSLGKCAGCPQAPKCLFHMPRYGGFKTQGKRYVAYALITDQVENSNGKQDFCTCETFVETLQDRMLSGQAAAAEGRKGAEIVRLLVDKRAGDTIRQGLEMGFNGRGEIIKPQPNQIDDLRASGHKVNLDDLTPAVRFDIVTFDRTIPDYDAPKKTHSTYSESIRQEESELQRSEIEDEASRYEARFAESEALHSKKRGRPPGSRNKPKDDEEADLA